MTQVPADPTAWGMPPDAVEIVTKRGRHHKYWRLSNGQEGALFGHEFHYEDADNQWQDVDPTWGDSTDPTYSDYADKLRYKVGARSDGHRRIWPRRNVPGEYIEFSPLEAQVNGVWQQITWASRSRNGNSVTWSRSNATLTATLTGGKLKIDVTLLDSSAAHPIRWPVSLTGLTRDGWNLVSASDGSVVAVLDQPTLEDAAGVTRDVNISITGGAVVFTADLSGLSFPVVVDPTTTFSVAASGDDATIQSASVATYPPSAGASVDNGTFLTAHRTHNTNGYFVWTPVIWWDTSSLGAGSTISSTATFRGYVKGAGSADARSIMVEWYAGANRPADVSDWSLTSTGDANTGVAISSLVANADNDIALTGADTHIDPSGYTGIRLHVSGGQPTGDNHVYFAPFDDTTNPEPRLLIIYTPPPTGTLSGTVTDAGTTYAAKTVASGPASYWRLGEASGTVANDETGAVAGTYSGGVTLGVAGLLTNDPDTAVSFNGTNGAVNLGDTYDFAGNAPFTILGSFQPGTLTGAFQKLACKHSGTPKAGYELFLQADGTLAFHRTTGGNNTNVTGTALSVGTTYRIGVSYDGATVSLYVNGALVSSAADPGPLDATTVPLMLGIDSDGTSAPANGVLDEVVLYTRGLSATEMSDDYTAATTGPTGIAGATVSLNDPNASTATTDVSGNYSVPTVDAGTWTATASAPNYTPQTASVTISSGATTTQDFALVRSAQTITLTGIPTAELFGTPRLSLSVVLSGVPSTEAFGTLTLTRLLQSVELTGIPSAEAFGSLTLTRMLQEIALTGIPSAETFGTLHFALPIYLTGIPSQEVFGTPQINQHVTLAGIPTGEAFGIPRTALRVSLSGIVSGEALGIPSVIPGAATITLVGIDSGEAFGTLHLRRGLPGNVIEGTLVLLHPVHGNLIFNQPVSGSLTLKHPVEGRMTLKKG